ARALDPGRNVERHQEVSVREVEIAIIRSREVEESELSSALRRRSLIHSQLGPEQPVQFACPGGLRLSDGNEQLACRPLSYPAIVARLHGFHGDASSRIVEAPLGGA